ncbi:extracellular solute-binding protein (plasmid) [Devosia sp. A8/3-2]|nr:extracellular solute-binding protein [Devosia sp. A8/3-2]
MIALADKGLPMPATREDLIKPAYKNEIAMPSPMQSGTGTTILTTFVDAFGWPFVENLHENVYQYSDGGSGGAQLAGTGEVTIGLSYDTTCYATQSSGRPVDVVFGRITPNTSEGGGPVASAQHPEEAKIFLDWLASKGAAEILGDSVGATAVPGYGLVNLDEVTTGTCAVRSISRHSAASGPKSSSTTDARSSRTQARSAAHPKGRAASSRRKTQQEFWRHALSMPLSSASPRASS